jgi:hypothetical protein
VYNIPCSRVTITACPVPIVLPSKHHKYAYPSSECKNWAQQSCGVNVDLTAHPAAYPQPHFNHPLSRRHRRWRVHLPASQSSSRNLLGTYCYIRIILMRVQIRCHAVIVPLVSRQATKPIEGDRSGPQIRLVASCRLETGRIGCLHRKHQLKQYRA